MRCGPRCSELWLLFGGKTFAFDFEAALLVKGLPNVLQLAGRLV